MIALLLALACGSGSARATGETPPPAPAPSPAPVDHPGDLLFRGACDASGAAWGPDGRLWVADDERNLLRSWAPTGGDPSPALDLGLGAEEADLEGAATIGDRIWWIGSHGRNKSAKPRPSRQVLLATDPAGHVIGRTGLLLPALTALPDLGPALAKAEPNPPKEGGIAIEGLAAAGQDLYIGFRSPLSSDGKAFVTRLHDPPAVLAGGAPALDPPVLLDLGGRGVRSLEWDPGRKVWWIVAGPPGKAGSFALFRWTGPGSAPEEVPADLAGLGAEALVVGPDGRLLVLADDGTKPVGDGECKAAPEAMRSFRGRWLAVP